MLSPYIGRKSSKIGIVLQQLKNQEYLNHLFMVQEESKAKEHEFIPDSNVVLNVKPMEFTGKYIIE